MIFNWLKTIRPQTLSASIAPILLSQVLVYQFNSDIFSWTLAIVIATCALSLQVSVNLANDYFDDKSGVDTPHRLGPARAIQAGTLTSEQVKQGMLVSLSIASLLGLYLISLGGILYAILGVLCIAGVLGYSAGPKPLASNALGEVAVFFFFGPIAVIGGAHLQLQENLTFELAITLLLYAAQMGLLAAAIMLVNNIRDMNTDKQANKITLAIHLSSSYSRVLYLIMLSSIPILAYINEQHYGLIIIAVIAALTLTWLIFKREAQRLNRQLAQTAAYMLLWSLSNTLSRLVLN